VPLGRCIVDPSSIPTAHPEHRCERCGGRATVAVASFDGVHHAHHRFCRDCEPNASAEDCRDALAECSEPLLESEVEARQSASWATIEQFLREFEEPGPRARPVTEEEMRRIVPRVLRMVGRQKDAMPDAVRTFLARYRPPAG
jgi:hypothetical protein